MSDDPRLHAPATARNRDALLATIRTILPPTGLVLEVASGSGEHTAHFAAALSGLTFQPTDLGADALASIDAWNAGLPNVQPALLLDVTRPWPVAAAAAVLCSNMIHIAPWAATEGLIDGAAKVLGRGSPLILYGPFRRDGAHTAASNAEFDADLRARNPEWGVRDLAAVATLAAAAGFGPPVAVPMPANNLTLVFRRG